MYFSFSHQLQFTTTTAQFSFFNCKFDFTTAEIVISYMLKYALTKWLNQTLS